MIFKQLLRAYVSHLCALLEAGTAWADWGESFSAPSAHGRNYRYKAKRRVKFMSAVGMKPGFVSCSINAIISHQDLRLPRSAVRAHRNLSRTINTTARFYLPGPNLFVQGSDNTFAPRGKRNYIWKATSRAEMGHPGAIHNWVSSNYIIPGHSIRRRSSWSIACRERPDNEKQKHPLPGSWRQAPGHPQRTCVIPVWTSRCF